jgi:hypothetical protein
MTKKICEILKVSPEYYNSLPEKEKHEKIIEYIADKNNLLNSLLIFNKDFGFSSLTVDDPYSKKFYKICEKLKSNISTLKKAQLLADWAYGGEIKNFREALKKCSPPSEKLVLEDMTILLGAENLSSLFALIDEILTHHFVNKGKDLFENRFKVFIDKVKKGMIAEIFQQKTNNCLTEFFYFSFKDNLEKIVVEEIKREHEKGDINFAVLGLFDYDYTEYKKYFKFEGTKFQNEFKNIESMIINRAEDLISRLSLGTQNPTIDYQQEKVKNKEVEILTNKKNESTENEIREILKAHLEETIKKFDQIDLSGVGS